MAENLTEYLKEHPPQGWNAVPHYFPAEDYLTYYFRNDRCFSQRVDDLLTVYVSFETKELVGCKIKGVRHILQTAGDFEVTLDDGEVSLGFFFFVGASMAKDDAQRSRYEQIGKKAKDVRMKRKELEAVS
jgi:hypothetical protein